MVKLAIVTDDPGKGGAYKVAADIAIGLDKYKYEIRWYFLCDKVENGPIGTYLSKPPISINYSLISYLRLAFFSTETEKSFSPLNTELELFQPDIIHFHTHPILLTLTESIKKIHVKAKYIYTDHLQRIRHDDTLKQKYLMSRVYKKLFSNLRVVFISEYAFQTAILLKYGSVKKDFLISNSVNTKKFHPKNNTVRSGIKVVYLARIHRIKGHHLLLDAWQQLPKIDDLSLHLYGPVADDGEIVKRIRGEQFPNPVVYEGITHLPDKVMQNSNVGVFPSYREGLPLALLEMMASGLPVVASSIPEIKNVIIDGVNGLIFSCSNPSDLAEKLLSIINNAPLRKKLGDKARETVVNEYGVSIAKRYEMVYQHVEKK